MRQNKGRFLSDKIPFYSEGFVNMERPDNICHVSSITPLDENRMVCVWYSGSKEGAKDVAIYSSIFDEEKRLWTNPVVLIDRKQSSKELNRYIKKIGNPLLFRDKKGRLWLFYASVTFGGWSGTSLNYKVSLNGGVTWSKSRKMTLSPFFNLANNVKNKGINFEDGSFVIPVYHEFIKNFSQLVHVIPADSSVRWEIRKMTHQRNAIQPCLLHNQGKYLTAFFRNMEKDKERHILTANSNDMGQSWSELSDTSLPNPNSGFDMIKLSKDAYLGVINYSFNDRSNLSLVISHDRGKTWRLLKILEDLDGREYSYPSINLSDRGLYHVTYTYERQRIKHIVFNEAWIRQLERGLP
ncbi:MAG: sialidase family protein [Nitrospirota bacterium]